MSNPLIPKQFQSYSSHDLYSESPNTELIREVTLVQGDKTEFSEWDGYGVAYGFTNAREYSYTLRKLNERKAVGYFTNYYAQAGALESDRVYDELVKNPKIHLYLTESNPWMVNKEYAEKEIKTKNPTLYKQLEAERLLDKTYQQNKAVVDMINADSNAKRAFLVGNDNLSMSSGENEFQQHAKVTATLLDNNQRFVRIDTAAVSTIMGGWLGFNGIGAMGIGRTELFLQTNNPKLVKEVDQFLYDIEQNKKPLHRDNQYFFGSKDPLHTKILADIINSTGDIFIHGATLELIGEDPISHALVQARKQGRNITVLSAGGRETKPTLQYLKEQGINVSITNKYIPGTGLEKNILVNALTSLPGIKQALAGASEHSNVVVIKGLGDTKDTVTYLGSARLTGVFTHRKEGRPDTSVEGTVRLLESEVKGLDKFVVDRLLRRYKTSETQTSRYLFDRGMKRLYEPEFIVNDSKYSIKTYHLPYIQSKSKDATKRFTYSGQPNYSISLPAEHFLSYSSEQRLPIISTYQMLYESRVPIPESVEGYQQYNKDLEYLKEFDRQISTPNLGQYINWKAGKNIYTEGYGLGGSLFSYVGRQLDNLFGFDDMLAERDEIKRKKVIRTRQFIALHDKPPQDQEIGQFETILNTMYQTASGVAIALGTYTSINLPVQHIRAKFEDVFTEQFFAPAKPHWTRTGAINTFFFGGTLGMTVSDATTKVWSAETKTWAVDAKGNYITPTARQQVAYNLVRAQSEIIAAKRRLEDNLIQTAINKGLADGGQLDHKSRLINALEYLDDSEFNEVKNQTIVEITNEKEQYVKKKAAQNNIKLKDSQIRRVTSYLDAMTATSRDQLLEGRVVIGSTSEFLSYYGVSSAFRKFDTARFDLLLAPILRNINPYEFSANPDSAFGVYNASVEEFRRTLSQGIHIVYDAEAKGAKSSVRLANTGVQRNMELAKSLDRIGHLLPVNLFYWMPSVRKALRLPAFDNKENIVWADVFSIEQKTKQVEATLDYLGRATGIRWHKIGVETPENPLKRLFFRGAELVRSILMPIPTTAQTILRSVELLARQRIVDQSYKNLEKDVLKPLYQSYNEKISKTINDFNAKLVDLDQALSKMDELDPAKAKTVEIEDADGNTKTVKLKDYTRRELIKEKGELIRSLITTLEENLLGSPVASQVNRIKGDAKYIATDDFYTLNDFDKSDLDPKIKERLRDYQTKRAALERTGKQLMSIGFVEPQEVINPLDKEANAGKRNLSLAYKPSAAKEARLKMFRGTLKVAGTLLLTDAAVDFAFLNSGVSIFRQLKARHILSLTDLHKAEGLSKEDLDHPSRGAAHFRFDGTPGMALTLGTASTFGILGGILFPTNITPPAQYQLTNKFKTVEDELSEIKNIIDHIEKEVDGEVNRLPIETREAQKAYFGKKVDDGKKVDVWDATESKKINSINKFKAIEERLNTALTKANSIELNRLNYRFNKKTAWGGFILGLLGAKLAGGVIANISEWRYNDEPMLTKTFKLLTGNLNNRPDMDAVSSVLSSYMENAAGELYDNRTTVEDLAVAAALEFKAYSSIKVTERKNMVYNMATQATLPFFQLAMIGRINDSERKITLGTAFQLNATLGLGISPILPVAIRLSGPALTKEQQIEANELKKYQLGKGFNEINLTAEDVEQIKNQSVINLLTAGSQFVYEKDSNFEAAITFLGTARLLGQVSKGFGYAYERSTLRTNLKVDTAVKSFTQWTDSMPVSTARALMHGTVKHLVNLPVFFADSSIRAIRKSRAATTLAFGASAYFFGSSLMREYHERGFRNKYGLTDDDLIPEELRDRYGTGQALYELATFTLAAGTGFFMKPTEGSSQITRPVSSNRRMFNRLSRSAGTLALATYTGFFVSRLISDPSTSFKGYSTGTDRQAFEATVGIGTVLTAGFLAGGVFTSEESLLESYKARLQAEPDYKAKLKYELKKVVGETIIESEYGEDVINNLVKDYQTEGRQSFGVKVKRLLMTTDTMTEMVGARLFEQGQGDGLRVVASSRYNLLSARLGQAYAIYALTRLAALGIVSTASSEQRDALYQLPFVGESLKVLSGVGGFDAEDTFKYNYQPSLLKTFIPEVAKILTFNILNLEPYQDKSDPFFNLIGSFGLSFKQSGVSSYFQLASTSSDLSISSFNIAQNYLSELDAFQDIVNAKGLPPKKLYNIMRGRKARTTPMGFVPISEDTQSALGGSLGLSTALDIRLLKQANISFQRPDEIAQDLYLEGLLTGRISHGMFKDFENNKLPKRINSLDHLKGGQFFLGEPGSELMVDENGDIVVRKESQLIYKPVFLQNILEDSVFKDRLIVQSGGFGSFFSGTFQGLSQVVGDTPVGKIGLGYVAPFLTMTAIGLAAFQSISTGLYLSRRRQTLELFEETYMSRATVSGQASRYQFKVVNYGERKLLAQIDLATGREGKVFGLAYFDELLKQTVDAVDAGAFQTSLLNQLNTAHNRLIKDLNVFFNTDINKQVQSLLEEVNQHYLSDNRNELKILDLKRKEELAESLRKTLLNKLTPILSKNIKNTNITIGQLLYGIEDSNIEDFLTNLIDNKNNSLTKSLANNLIDTINQYSSLAKNNPNLVNIATSNVAKGKSMSLTQALDMLRAAQGVNRVIDPHVNHYAGQLIYQLTEPRLNQFDVEDPQLKKDVQAGMTDFERQQARLKQEARALAESQGLYGKKVWGETALSDIGNYGFRLVGNTVNNYLQYVQPIYETVEGAAIGLDASKSKQERERGYTWASKFFTYNTTSLVISVGVAKLGVPGLAAFLIGGTLQVGLMTMLHKDPQYAQKEHEFFRKIGDKLVPDDGSKGFHLTPLVKPINTITGEVTGPILAEIHGKEKPQWAGFLTNFLLPQTQYIEEWDMKQNAKRKAIEQFKKTITIKGSATAEYIHPELLGRPVGLIQEVRYHRYFKTNAFGGRVLSDFSVGAYRPSGLMMLALSRRQSMSDYYIGHSMVTNILDEASRPPDEEGFKELGVSIAKLTAGVIGGSLLLKYTGLGYLGAGIADWMIGGLSGKLANYMFGPKYEASRQARFIMDDAMALLGIKDKKNVPLIEYGGPQATATYYEDGKIILSHTDALSLASRRTGSPDTVDDARIKYVITHELIHHQQVDPTTRQFTEDSSLTGKSVGNPNSPTPNARNFVDMKGEEIWDFLEKVKAGDESVKGTSITKKVASNILDLTIRSTNLAVETAEAQGLALDENTVKLIRNNEVQAHFLAYQVIDESNALINPTPPSSDLDTSTPLENPVDRLREGTASDAEYRGLSSPDYIVKGGGFVSEDHYTTRDTLISNSGLEETLREGTKVDPDNPTSFNRRYAGTDSNSSFRQLPDGKKVFPNDQFEQLNWGIVETTIEKGWFGTKRTTHAGPDLDFIMDTSSSRSSVIKFREKLGKADFLYTHKKEDVQGNIKKDAFYLSDQKGSLLIIRHSLEELPSTSSSQIGKVVDKYYVIPLNQINTAQDQGGVIKARAVYEDIFKPWIQEQLPSDSDYWKGNLEETVRFPSSAIDYLTPTQVESVKTINYHPSHYDGKEPSSLPTSDELDSNKTEIINTERVNKPQTSSPSEMPVSNQFPEYETKLNQLTRELNDLKVLTNQVQGVQIMSLKDSIINLKTSVSNILKEADQNGISGDLSTKFTNLHIETDKLLTTTTKAELTFLIDNIDVTNAEQLDSLNKYITKAKINYSELFYTTNNELTEFGRQMEQAQIKINQVLNPSNMPKSESGGIVSSAGGYEHSGQITSNSTASVSQQYALKWKRLRLGYEQVISTRDELVAKRNKIQQEYSTFDLQNLSDKDKARIREIKTELEQINTEYQKIKQQKHAIENELLDFREQQKGILSKNDIDRVNQEIKSNTQSSTNFLTRRLQQINDELSFLSSRLANPNEKVTTKSWLLLQQGKLFREYYELTGQSHPFENVTNKESLKTEPTNKDRLSEIRKEFDILTKRRDELNKEFRTANEARKAEIKAEFEPLKAQHAKLVAEYNTLTKQPSPSLSPSPSLEEGQSKAEPKVYTNEELTNKLTRAQRKKFDAVNILQRLGLSDSIIKITDSVDNRSTLVSYAEQMTQYKELQDNITLLENTKKTAKDKSVIDKQIKDVQTQLDTSTQQLKQTTQTIQDKLGLTIVNNPWDTETVEVGKGQIGAQSVLDLGNQIKKADEAIKETKDLIDEQIANNRASEELKTYQDKLKWEGTKATLVDRPEPIPVKHTPSLDGTNYLKSFVKRAAENINKATTNVEGLKLSLSPVELISETGRYLTRVSDAIHTKDADMNVGKTLVLGLGAFDLVTTYFNKSHTQTQLGKIAFMLKAGKISKDEAKKYLADLRHAERSSNLATGTSLGISLFSNSFLFNLIPSLLIGSTGGSIKDNFEEYDSQIKQLVEADLDRLLNKNVNIAREGEEAEYYYGSIASDQTFSLSSTAKSYRENKVLTNLIDQNDVIQKGIAKKIKLDKIFGGIVWAADKVLSQRTGRLGIGAAGVLGFGKLISNERDRFYAEWEQLDSFKKSQYGEFDKYYQQHRNKFLIGGQWLSGLTVAVETINVAWDVGSYAVAWGAHHSANLLGHLTGRKATVKGGRIHNEGRLQEAIESIDKQSEIAKGKAVKAAKAEQGAKTSAQATILPESDLSIKVEIDVIDSKPQVIIEPNLTLPQIDDLTKVGDTVPEKLVGQEALDQTLGGRLKSAWRGLFTKHTKENIPKKTPKVKKPKPIETKPINPKPGWWANTKYNTRKWFSDIQHSINSSRPVKVTADTVRGAKVAGNEKFFTPIGQALKGFKNAVSSGTGKIVNISFPQLDTYIAQTGIRGSAINTLGPGLDILFYLSASHEIKNFDKSTTPDFMFATTYKEAGRSGGSLAGSIMGMRSSGFVADILFSFAYAEDFANRMEVLGLRRYKYFDYYKGREGLLGSSLLQTELNLITLQESRTGARAGNAMNAGLGLVLDVYRRKDEYEVYRGKKFYKDPIKDAVGEIKTPGRTIDDVLHTAKQADPRVSRRVYKLKKLGVAGIVAKVDKEKEAVLTRALGAERIAAMEKARRVRGKSLYKSLYRYKNTGDIVKRGKSFRNILSTSAKVATVGDGAFKGFLGSSLLGTAIDTGMIFASGHLHKQAVDIMTKHDYSEKSVEAAFELFESSQRMKSSSVFSLLGTFTGALAGSTFGLKGAEVGSALGGLTGGTFGDKIGQRTVKLARENNFTDFDAIGKGQNIGLGTGLAIGAGVIALAAFGVITAPLWVLAAGVFALGATGYTFGGHLPIFSEDGITAEGIGEAAKETAITLAQSAWYVGDQGVRNTGKFLRWGGRTIKSGAKAGVQVSKTIGRNIIRDFKKSVSGEMLKGELKSTGRTAKSLEVAQRRQEQKQAKQINKQITTAKDNRNWVDRVLFPAAQANELNDYLTQKQADNKVTTVKQYLGQIDLYYSPTNSELLGEEENTLEAHRKRTLFDEFMTFKKESEGFFKWLTDSKWFKGLARITAFIFSPVQMFYRFGKDFLKNPGEAIGNLWDRTTRKLNNWKDKIGNFWNRTMNNLFGGGGEYHDPYTEERAHQHKFVGRLLKGIGIDYNAVPDVSNITTVGQLYKAFGAAMGWKSEADAEAAARMGLSEFGSNAVTVATVFASTRNRQIAIESGNSNLAVTPAASVSWSTIISSPGQYQVYRDGSMQRVQLTPTNIQKVAQAAAIVSTGQLVNKLMAGEGIDRPLSKQDAENIANSVAFSVPSALWSGWNRGVVTINAQGSNRAHSYAYSDNTKNNYIQLGQTKYPRFSTGSGGNQKPKGFNAKEIMGALRDNFVFYAETYNGPNYGTGFDLAGTMIVFPVQGKNRGDYKLADNQTFSAWRYWRNGPHLGEDFGARAGTALIAMQEGVIHEVSWKGGSTFAKVVLKFEVNGKTYYADYGHVKNIIVKQGQRVAAGQKLAEITTVGGPGSGYSTFEHLDIKLWTINNGKKVFIDPTQSGFWKNSINSKDLPKYAKAEGVTGKRLVRPFTADEESIIRRQFDSRRASGFIKEAEARGYKKQAMATNLVNTTFKDPKTGKTIQLQKEAYLAFQQMQQAALADGINLGILSGYRSLQQQAALLQANANKTNAEILNTQAPVGYSKHSTGLAVDIGTMEKGLVKENTPEYNWLVNNAARFGYQISYPKGNKQGPGFEAWEWSYVGGNQSATAPDSGKLINLSEEQIKNIKAVLQPGKAITPGMIQDAVYAMEGAGRSKEEIEHFKQGAANYNASLSEEEKKRLEGIINGTIKDPYADFKLDRSLKDIPSVSYPTSESSSSASTAASSSSSSSSSSSDNYTKPYGIRDGLAQSSWEAIFPKLQSKPPQTFQDKYSKIEQNLPYTEKVKLVNQLKKEFSSRPDIVRMLNEDLEVFKNEENSRKYREANSLIDPITGKSITGSQKPSTTKQTSNRSITQVQFDNRIKDQMGRFNRSGNINYLEQAIRITEQYIKDNPQDSKAKEQLRKLRSIHNNTPKPGPLRKLLNILGQKDKENVLTSYASAVGKSKITNNGNITIHNYNEAQLKQVALATDEEIDELVLNQQKEAELIKEIRQVTQEVVKAKDNLKRQAAIAYKIEGASNVKEPQVDNNQLQIAQKPKQATVKTEQTGSNKYIKIEISQPGQYVVDNYHLLTNAAPSSEYSLLDNSA